MANTYIPSSTSLGAGPAAALCRRGGQLRVRRLPGHSPSVWPPAATAPASSNRAGHGHLPRRGGGADRARSGWGRPANRSRLRRSLPSPHGRVRARIFRHALYGFPGTACRERSRLRPPAPGVTPGVTTTGAPAAASTRATVTDNDRMAFVTLPQPRHRHFAAAAPTVARHPGTPGRDGRGRRGPAA